MPPGVTFACVRTGMPARLQGLLGTYLDLNQSRGVPSRGKERQQRETERKRGPLGLSPVYSPVHRTEGEWQDDTWPPLSSSFSSNRLARCLISVSDVRRVRSQIIDNANEEKVYAVNIQQSRSSTEEKMPFELSTSRATFPPRIDRRFFLPSTGFHVKLYLYLGDTFSPTTRRSAAHLLKIIPRVQSFE